LPQKPKAGLKIKIAFSAPARLLNLASGPENGPQGIKRGRGSKNIRPGKTGFGQDARKRPGVTDCAPKAEKTILGQI